MKKCIKLLCHTPQAQYVLESFIAKNAQHYQIEGVGQKIKEGVLQLYLCGQEEQVDEFIDALYVGSNEHGLTNINIETSSVDRSYRGVFRIVE